MNILIDIGHPGQVHLFRNVIELLKRNNHKVIVTVKDIPSAIILLKAFYIPFTVIGSKFDSLFLKGLSQIRYDYNLHRIARDEKIDIAVGSSITITHVSVLHPLKAIVLDDDDAEAVKLFSLFAHPFADCILSPFPLAHQRTGDKDLTYRGTHELFYLYPKYFKPDPSILDDVGVAGNEMFFILRFVSGKAYHDKSEKWLTTSQKMRIIKLLESSGKVFITTEREIEPEFQKWQLRIAPEKVHHLMYYATMFVGDSQTMTSEAAILGTPALKCNTFAHKLSIPNMLEEKYDLCYSYQPAEFDRMIEKIRTLLGLSDIKQKWLTKREKFLNDSIDPTSFLVWFIENYPASLKIMKEDPECQNKFK